MGRVRRHRPRAAQPGRRRDAARPERQAGRRVPDPRLGAPGAHCQLQPRPEVGDLGGLPRARGGRADDVRPDDRRVLDLHRDPGDPPGDVRDLRRARAPALRRLAARHAHRDGRARRDGRGPAAGRDDERWGGNLHRGGPGPRAPSSRDRLCRSAHRGPAGSAGMGPRRDRRARAAVDRPDRERGRDRAGLGEGRRAVRHRHRPDQRPRRARRVRPGRDQPGRCARAPVGPARGLRRTGDALDGGPGPSDARVPVDRSDRLRLRQQPPGDGQGSRCRGRLLLSGVRPGLHPSAVRRGQRPVSLGGAQRGPRGHLSDRSRPGRAVPGQGRAPPLARDGPRAGPVPGVAGPDLLARLRRTRPRRSRVQSTRRGRRAQGADRHRPRPPRLGLRRLAEPRNGGDARRQRRGRRLADPQRVWSTRPPAPRGSASTRVAESASATASTPGWWSWPTARRSRPRSSSGS